MRATDVRCDYWSDGARCWRVPTRPYMQGRRCDDHAPAALAGHTVPTPDPTLTLYAQRDAGREARRG